MKVRSRLAVLVGAVVLGSGMAATAGSAAALVVPMCAGMPVTIIAQPGMATYGDGGGFPTADVIQGTPGNDVIYGLQANDVICGNGGDDVIYAGVGGDLVLGGDGDDNIDAGAGADTVYGGEGDDNVLAGDGNDAVYGENGDDDMAGEDGMDLLDGGPHNLGDRANGGAAADACPNDETVINC